MTPDLDRVYLGSCLDVMRGWPAGFVQTVVTSPPYWGLRDYGTPPQIWGGERGHAHSWGAGLKRRRGGPAGDGAATRGRDQSARDAVQVVDAGAFCPCGAWRGSLGLEPTPEQFVAHLVEVFAAVRRVLRDDGTVWLNIGDSYAASFPGSRGDKSTIGSTARQREAFPARGRWPGKASGLKPKDVVGVPWMLAFALRADGWHLRQDIIWNKPNPMPESVTDRCTKAHEYVFLLSKRRRYYYDAKAIQEKAIQEKDSWNTHPRGTGVHPKAAAVELAAAGPRPKANASFSAAVKDAVEYRNKRSVWTVPTQPFGGNHFATFPPALVAPCILAGAPKGGVVLDPFMGSGTTAMVAARYGRRFLGVDLLPANIPMATARAAADLAQGHLI